jgi:hypothetical protein
MRQFAKRTPAAHVKKPAAPVDAERPQWHRTGPPRGAIWQAIQRKAAPEAVSAPESLSQLEPPGALKAPVEQLSGPAMDDVHLHRNSPELAQPGALAFAQGNNIQPVLQLQRFEAEPPQKSGAWTDGDFVRHYYLGKGRAVDLGNLGWGDVFRNHPSVRRAVEEFVALAFAQPASVTSFEKSTITNVVDKIFSVGHSTFFRVASRGSSHWGFHFSIRDWFRDPISRKIELGGTPYRINFGWTETRPRPDK